MAEIQHLSFEWKILIRIGRLCIVDTFKDFLYKFESRATENEIWYHFQVLLIRNPSTRLGRFCVTNWSSFGWTESKYRHLNFWLCKLRYVLIMRLTPSWNLAEIYNTNFFSILADHLWGLGEWGSKPWLHAEVPGRALQTADWHRGRTPCPTRMESSLDEVRIHSDFHLFSMWLLIWIMCR